MKFGGTFWFPAMEAMEMESERSLQRKQATYTSLVTTLLLFFFLFYSIFGSFYLSTSSLAFRLVAEKPWKTQKENRSLTLANYRWFLNLQPLVAILMVSQYPDGYSMTVLTKSYYNFVILSLALSIAGRAV